MTDKQTVRIHGKDYETVASRVARFRADEPNANLSILTDLISADDTYVIMKASIVDENDRVLATGHAEERRTSSGVNETSALENCETSAIGRALASYGYAGDEFASADEVAQAISQQKENPVQKIRDDLRRVTNPKDVTPSKESSGELIHPDIMYELNTLPKKLGLSDEQKKSVWDRAFRNGWKRWESWDKTAMKPIGEPTIPQSAVPTIIKWFAEAAGKDPSLLTAQILGDDAVDEISVDNYSDEPF